MAELGVMTQCSSLRRDEATGNMLTLRWNPKSPLRNSNATESNLAGLVVDLNADGREEFVLFVNALGHVYQQSGATWSHIGVINTKGYAAVTDLHAALSGDKFTTELLEWRDLKIGKYRFRFYPGDAIEADEGN